MAITITRRSALTAAAASLTLTACGSTAASTADSDSESLGELLPFSDVQENEFAFESDPNDPGRGIFRVRTTEPMICAIVWGETEDFGKFNNSLAMNGTGIIDHDVVLPGATSGTTYFFRVQGSVANGNQYRSPIDTFTVPAFEGEVGDSITRGPNLASSATIAEVSSIFGPGWEAENAIDSDSNTEWASADDGDTGFITLDLGAEQEIAGVEFITRSMLDGTATTEMFTATIGADTFGPFPAGNPANPRFAAVVATGRQIRFDVDTSTGGNVGAIEINAFGPVDT